MKSISGISLPRGAKFRRLAVEELPPLFLAYLADPSDSGMSIQTACNGHAYSLATQELPTFQTATPPPLKIVSRASGAYVFYFILASTPLCNTRQSCGSQKKKFGSGSRYDFTFDFGSGSFFNLKPVKNVTPNQHDLVTHVYKK
jgi:hypothetical protein